MKLNIVRIGNSNGVRIPKALLEQCGFKDKVIVKVENGTLILIPDDTPRVGWEESFKAMAKAGDDALLDPDTIESDFDKNEWEW